MDYEKSYPYTNGVIKVIESKILDKAKLSKINRENKTLFIKSLCEMGYGQFNENTTIENLIEHELVAAKKLIDQLSPQPDQTDLFFMANDALNIKFMYKKKIFGITYLDAFAQTGTMSKSALESAIFQNDNSALKPSIKQLLKDVENNINGITNPRLLSAIIDKTVYEYVFANLKSFGNTVLKVYFSLSVDISNILSLLRAKVLKWDITKFQEVFIPNGEIKSSVFEELYNKNDKEIVKSLADYYDGKLSKILKTYFEDLDLNTLESMFDGYIISTMKEYRNDSFGIGPMIYYYLEKISEAKNIRLLYSDAAIKNGQILDY